MGEVVLGEAPQQAIQPETQNPTTTGGKPDENGSVPDDDHRGKKDLSPTQGKEGVTDERGEEGPTSQEDREAIMEVTDPQNLAELMKIAPEASRVMLEIVAKGPNNPEIYESIAKARRQELLKKPPDQLTDDERKILSFTYDLEIAGLQMRLALLEKKMSSEKSHRQQFYQQEIEKIKIQIQGIREQRTANCQLNTGEIPNQVDAFCQMFGQQNLEGVRDFFKQAASNKEQRQKLVEYVEKNFGDESAEIVKSYFSRIGRRETGHKIAIGVGAGILIFGLLILFSTRKKGAEGMM